MEPMRHRSWLFFAAALVLTACIWAQPAHAKMIDGIVAVVDNMVIMDSDLRKKMLELEAPPDDRNAQRQVLELMVEDIVIEKIYRSMGMPAVKDADAQKVADQMKISTPTAKTFIMKSHLMEMMVRSRVVITDKMIKDYYESHSEYQGRESVRLSQLVVTNDEEKLGKVLAELKEGAPFDEVAGRYSDIPASRSPDIGWVPLEDLSDEMRKGVESSKPGDVIGPIDLGSGKKAVYLYAEKAVVGTKKLDDVREGISNTLEKKYQQEAFTYWLHKMMTQYFIGIYI
jgi:peptidyl-prolyl cis-trans isomerase SurA